MVVAAATLAAAVVGIHDVGGVGGDRAAEKSGGEVGRWRVFELSMVISKKDLNWELLFMWLRVK